MTAKRILIKEFLMNGPEDARFTFIFAHGAGQGMASPFMETIATGIGDAGIRVVRFHFPYMEEMVRSGRKRLPDGGGILRKAFTDVVGHFTGMARHDPRTIVIGGKSMGGRIASMIADDLRVRGVVSLGYPFHPPRKPKLLRLKHLKEIKTPMLICQGERDAFGKPGEIAGYRLSRRIQITWLADGDHNFRPRAASGHTEPENLKVAIDAAADFILSLPRSK